jgi:hypothetical protein
MLPLTPANQWTATVLFCGGTNLQPDQSVDILFSPVGIAVSRLPGTNRWVTDWNIVAFAASDSCVRLSPDISSSYVHDDTLPEGRTMGNLILLPTGKVLLLNGARTGTHFFLTLPF